MLGAEDGSGGMNPAILAAGDLSAERKPCSSEKKNGPSVLHHQQSKTESRIGTGPGWRLNRFCKTCSGEPQPGAQGLVAGSQAPRCATTAAANSAVPSVPPRSRVFCP
jgi:hypothetical protein